MSILVIKREVSRESENLHIIIICMPIYCTLFLQITIKPQHNIYFFSYYSGQFTYYCANRKRLNSYKCNKQNIIHFQRKIIQKRIVVTKQLNDKSYTYIKNKNVYLQLHNLRILNSNFVDYMKRLFRKSRDDY